MRRITCSECRFWNQDAHECRRNAPLDEWPSTVGDEWCGEAELPEAEAQPNVVVPTPEPAPAKPKFQVGQWVRCEDGKVGVITSTVLEGDPEAWEFDVGVGVAILPKKSRWFLPSKWRWLLPSKITLCAPDPRLRWPNGPPQPGQRVRVVQHSVHPSGEPMSPEEQVDGRTGSVVSVHLESWNSSSVVLDLPGRRYQVWLHNCEPVKQSKPLAEPDAQPNVVVPTPKPAEPEFQAGQWVQCNNGKVGVITRIEHGDSHALVYASPTLSRWLPVDTFTPCAPDPRVRWPLRPPWPGQKVRVVEHPAGSTGTVAQADAVYAGSLMVVGHVGISVTLTGTWLPWVQDKDGLRIWLHNCEPVAEGEG